MVDSSIPIFSVVIPLYKAGKKIIPTLESLRAQTLPAHEIIVVNDGTPDESCGYVEDFQRKHPSIPLILIHQTNGGPAKARNTGIKNSSGHWIAFLDQDDLWMPNKLEHVVKTIASLPPDCVMIYHRMREQFPDGHSISGMTPIHGSPQHVYCSLLSEGNSITNSSVVVKKNALLQVGLLDESRNLIATEDFDLWLRLQAIGSTHLINEELGIYLSDVGYSAANIARHRSNYIAALKKHLKNPCFPLPVKVCLKVFKKIVELHSRNLLSRLGVQP